jgi:hypothetical protein
MTADLLFNESLATGPFATEQPTSIVNLRHGLDLYQGGEKPLRP